MLVQFSFDKETIRSIFFQIVRRYIRELEASYFLTYGCNFVSMCQVDLCTQRPDMKKRL